MDKNVSDPRTKHKQDWKNFDRQNPPPWLQLGATGIDDKREKQQDH